VGEIFGANGDAPALVGELFDPAGSNDLRLFFVATERVGIDVLAAVRRVRAMHDDSAIVVLCLKASEDDETAALDAGADDVVTVPFDLTQVWPRLRARLGRVRPTSGERPVRRFVELDRRTHQALVDGRSVRLSPLEFRLLAELRSAQGSFVPHRRLEESVWGQASASTRQSLIQLVRRVRLRLGDGASSITSVPGVGYMLRAEPATEAAPLRAAD
jgi:DNA-binding response OmpR family regulator